MTRRSVPEWIGSNPDAAIPPRVRLRVYLAHDGICALTGRKIGPADAWQIDHRVPLALGGEHRESNLQPVLTAEHREKTKADVAAKAKADRVRKRHLGITARKAILPGSKASGWKRRLNGTVERRNP